MTLNLDAIAGVFCTVVAFAIGFLHIVTGPKRRHWLDLPEYVRVGLFVSAAAFLYWGVNLITLPEDLTVRGHINEEGLAALAVLAYTIGAITFWVVSKAYPEGLWNRIKVAEDVARKSGPWAALWFLHGGKVFQQGRDVDGDLDKRP